MTVGRQPTEENREHGQCPSEKPMKVAWHPSLPLSLTQKKWVSLPQKCHASILNKCPHFILSPFKIRSHHLPLLAALPTYKYSAMLSTIS